ncbi:MAG: hypothetical protein MH472_06035 [Bacteroidia bacterium]|nr:hypothetical protein [Bacteroidia bacterium]
MINAASTTYKNVLKAAFRGSLIASGINIAWLYSLEFLLKISGLPKGFPLAVVLSTIIPLLLGAILYVVFVKNFKKGEVMFLMLASGFTLLSLFPSFEPMLPDGNPAPENFALLTVPMHFFAAVIGVFYILKKH